MHPVIDVSFERHNAPGQPEDDQEDRRSQSEPQVDLEKDKTGSPPWSHLSCYWLRNQKNTCIRESLRIVAHALVRAASRLISMLGCLA